MCKIFLFLGDPLYFLFRSFWMLFVCFSLFVLIVLGRLQALTNRNIGHIFWWLCLQLSMHKKNTQNEKCVGPFFSSQFVVANGKVNSNISPNTLAFCYIFVVVLNATAIRGKTLSALMFGDGHVWDPDSINSTVPSVQSEWLPGWCTWCSNNRRGSVNCMYNWLQRGSSAMASPLPWKPVSQPAQLTLCERVLFGFVMVRVCNATMLYLSRFE